MRKANITDCHQLAILNKMLIKDEGHSNKMDVEDLRRRMETFISTNYLAWLYEINNETVGYCLYRKETDYYYIRQLFVRREYRRQGIGRKIIDWLKKNEFQDSEIRIEVLCNNELGKAFWNSMGFEDYCITMKLKK